MNSRIWFFLALARVLLASGQTVNFTLRPFDEVISGEVTPPSVRSLPSPSSFGENSGPFWPAFGNSGSGGGSSNGGSSSGSNQQGSSANGGVQVQIPLGFPAMAVSQYGGPNGPIPFSPYGPPIAPLTPLAAQQNGFLSPSPLGFGQQQQQGPNGFYNPWLQSPQGFQPQQPSINPFFGGANGGWTPNGPPQQQFNPFAQQQQQQFGSYPPMGIGQSPFGQQPSFPFNPYQQMGPPQYGQYGQQPPPGFFPGGGPQQPMDADDRFNFNSDQRNYVSETGPFGMNMIGKNPPMVNQPSPPRNGGPQFPLPPAFPAGGRNGHNFFGGGNLKPGGSTNW